MPDIIARIEITMDDAGNVNLTGTGSVLKNRAYALGLLELAKEVIKPAEPRLVQPAAGILKS